MCTTYCGCNSGSISTVCAHTASAKYSRKLPVYSAVSGIPAAATAHRLDNFILCHAVLFVDEQEWELSSFLSWEGIGIVSVKLKRYAMDQYCSFFEYSTQQYSISGFDTADSVIV